MTIHKSQGSTYQNIVVYLQFLRGRPLLYVACSRATSASGLWLIGTFKKPTAPLTTDPLSLEFQRHKENTIVPRFINLRQHDDDSIQIIFHNAQSLNKHWTQYSNDNVFRNSDVVLFGETWTLSTDHENLPNHLLIASADCSVTRSAKGSRIYVNRSQSIMLGTTYSNLIEEANGSCSITGVTLSNTRIICVYRSPNCSMQTMITGIKEAITSLRGSRTIIAGDFNCDILTTDSSKLTSEMDLLNLALKSPKIPTTKYGTMLDAFFADFPVDESSVYVSLTSYHSPIYAKFAL